MAGSDGTFSDSTDSTDGALSQKLHDGEFLAPVTYLFGASAPNAVGDVEATDSASQSHVPYEALRTGVVSGEVLSEDVPSEPTTLSSGPVGRERPTDGSFERVNNVSMHALARKGMSSAEMASLLTSRDIEPESIAEEIDRLQGVGLLDDRALAETLVRTLQDRKGLGRSAISAELRRRKIDGDAISEALESLDADDELARAIEIAQKRAAQLRSYDHETAKRRLGGYLMRRGYNGSVLSAAIAASLGAPGRGSSGTGPRFS
ncbi:MAG: regulatory protein RecX [Microbacteriaceae bacterium]